MWSYTSISPEDVALVIGTHRAPAVVDVRHDGDFNADPLLIPGSIRRGALNVESWGLRSQTDQ